METGNYLTAITVTATTPISCGGFNNRTYLNATLNVPQGSLEAYTTSDPWNNFLTIKEYDPTSVKSVNIESNTTDEVYLMDGRRVNTPQKGINILKSRDGRTRKLSIK